jgi:hypothetical protein
MFNQPSHPVLVSLDKLETDLQSDIASLKATANKKVAKILQPLDACLKDYKGADWFNKGKFFLELQRAREVIRVPATSPLTEVVNEYVDGYNGLLRDYERQAGCQNKALAKLFNQLLDTAAQAVSKTTGQTMKEVYSKLDSIGAYAQAEKNNPALAPLTAVAEAIAHPPRPARLDCQRSYGSLAVELDAQKILLQVKEILLAGKEEVTD